MRISKSMIKSGLAAFVLLLSVMPEAGARTCFLPDSEDCGEGDTNVSDISDVGSCRYYTCKDAGYKNDNPYQECYVENTVNIKNNKVSCYAVRCKMSQTACEEKAEGTNKCCNRDVASGCYYVGTCPKECDRSVYSYDSEQTGNGWTCISCHDNKGTFYKCNYDKTCEEQGYATSCNDEQIAEEVTSAKGQNGEKCYTCKGKPLSCPDGYSTTVKTCATGYKLETNGAIEGAACGKCVCADGYVWDGTSCKAAPDSKGNLYVEVEDGDCYSNVKLEGNGVEYLETSENSGNKLYKVTYGSTVNIKYGKQEDKIDEYTGETIESCVFHYWDLISGKVYQDYFVYNDEMYGKLRANDKANCVLGSEDCPEDLTVYDESIDGYVGEERIEVASISATRAIPYSLMFKNGYDDNDEEFQNLTKNYEFYMLYEPGKKMSLYNFTAYKCHQSTHDVDKNEYHPLSGVNYIGFMNGRPYLFGGTRYGSNKVSYTGYSVYTDNLRETKESENLPVSIRIRVGSGFGIYDNEGDTPSYDYFSFESITVCEPFMLSDKYLLTVGRCENCSEFVDYLIGKAEVVGDGRFAEVVNGTTGNPYPDTYLEVTRRFVKDNPNKTKFAYRFFGDNFPNSSSYDCTISCGDEDWNESINNGDGITINCANNGCANGATGTIEADYVVGASLEPKTPLPTGCTCDCTGGYTCIVK